MNNSIKKSERYAICLDYVDSVDLSIRQFLLNKSNVLYIDLKDLNEDFGKFYHWISAEGDFKQCQLELKKISNKNKSNAIKKSLIYLNDLFK